MQSRLNSAAFIAAVSPDVVLALLDEIEAPSAGEVSG
jgi:hypothetical protein